MAPRKIHAQPSSQEPTAQVSAARPTRAATAKAKPADRSLAATPLRGQALPLALAIDAYLDSLRLERGLSRNSILAYSRDLARFADFVAGYDRAVGDDARGIEGRHALAYAVSLGHFETRYMVPIVVPLCCAAAVGAAELLKNRAVLLAGAIVVVSVSGVAFAAKQVVRTQDMEIEPRVARIEAAEFIRSIADGPCSLRKSEVDDSDINAEGYVGLTAVALLSKCGIDPNARQAFVVEELSPEGQSPRPPIFERSYRYFDEDAEEWYDRRLVVYRIGGAS